MRTKRVVLRDAARRDVDAAVAHYLEEAGAEAALAFVDALEHALARIARHPAAGSLRYAVAVDVPDLRSWVVQRHPYLVFYVSRKDHIDVWRVLHGHRDIPGTLDPTESP